MKKDMKKSLEWLMESSSERKFSVRTPLRVTPFTRHNTDPIISCSSFIQ